MTVRVKPAKATRDEVALSQLKAHPRNYRKHPEDQLKHLAQSIREFGFYRAVVVAKDNTILAGHGVVEAARSLKLKKAPVIRLDILPNDRRALKLLAGDNEMTRLAEVDDRILTEMLKELSDHGELLGTGFDEAMLAAFAMVTRPAEELADSSAAAEWVGMPEFQAVQQAPKVLVTFKNEKDRERFLKVIGVKAPIKKITSAKLWTCRWPENTRDDLDSLRFDK